MVEALNINASSYIYASKKLKDDKEYSLLAVKAGISLEYVPEKFVNIREFVLEAVKYCGYEITDKFMKDIEIISYALSYSADLLDKFDVKIR